MGNMEAGVVDVGGSYMKDVMGRLYLIISLGLI